MGRTVDLDLAVNTLQQEMKLHPCGSGEWFVLSSCLGKLVNLPSAQPEPCEDAVSRADVEIAIENILRGVFVEYQDIAKKTASKLPSVTPKRKSMICGECLHCDSDTLYVTNPPKIQCRKTGNLHFTTDTCECGVDMRGEQE